MNLERVFPDDGTRPYAIHEIVLGDQFVSRPNQHLDDFERAGANRHRDAAREQFTSTEVELPLPGFVDQARALLGHPAAPDSGFFGSRRH